MFPVWKPGMNPEFPLIRCHCWRSKKAPSALHCIQNSAPTPHYGALQGAHHPHPQRHWLSVQFKAVLLNYKFLRHLSHLSDLLQQYRPTLHISSCWLKVPHGRHLQQALNCVVTGTTPTLWDSVLQHWGTKISPQNPFQSGLSLWSAHIGSLMLVTQEECFTQSQVLPFNFSHVLQFKRYGCTN